MLISIRQGLFESNSSSTHSICISKENIDKKYLAGQHIHFGIGEWGWEVGTVYDTADYLYTAILDSPSTKIADQRLEKLKATLDKYYITYSFEPVAKNEEYDYYHPVEANIYYGIDHGEECRKFVEAVLNDENMLLRWLFGDSFVETGNDNSCEGDAPCFCAYESYWDCDSGKDDEKQQPFHNEEKYDYFFKGN